MALRWDVRRPFGPDNVVILTLSQVQCRGHEIWLKCDVSYGVITFSPSFFPQATMYSPSDRSVLLLSFTVRPSATPSSA